MLRGTRREGQASEASAGLAPRGPADVVPLRVFFLRKPCRVLAGESARVIEDSVGSESELANEASWLGDSPTVLYLGAREILDLRLSRVAPLVAACYTWKAGCTSEINHARRDAWKVNRLFRKELGVQG